jgi:cytoskeletal protein RodZ
VTPNQGRGEAGGAAGTAMIAAARHDLVAWLAAARQARGLSIGDVSSKTKIQPRTLELLEAARFEDLPADVFLRGFIKSYARAVGLSEQEALDRYAGCGKELGPAAAQTARVVRPMVPVAAAQAEVPRDGAALASALVEAMAPARIEPVSAPVAAPAPIVVPEPVVAAKPRRTRRTSAASAATPATPESTPARPARTRARKVTAGEVVAAAWVDASVGASEPVAAKATRPRRTTVNKAAASVEPGAPVKKPRRSRTTSAVPASVSQVALETASADSSTFVRPTRQLDFADQVADIAVAAPVRVSRLASISEALELDAVPAPTTLAAASSPNLWLPPPSRATSPTTPPASPIAAAAVADLFAEPSTWRVAPATTDVTTDRAAADDLFAPPQVAFEAAAEATDVEFDDDADATPATLAPQLAQRMELPRAPELDAGTDTETDTDHASEPAAAEFYGPPVRLYSPPPAVSSPTVADPARDPWAAFATSGAIAPLLPTAVGRRAAPVSLVIDDDHPDRAELAQAGRERDRAERGRTNFLPPILRDQEKQARQGGLTLAVIILLIAATLTLSYLMRRPGSGGDGITSRATPASHVG